MNKIKLISLLAAGSIFAGTAFAEETPNVPEAAAPQNEQAKPKQTKTSTPKGWTDDFAEAQKIAKEQNKLIFVNFTGSDWCGWCIRLEKEILSQKEFLDGVKDKYVLVFIDSPNKKTLLSENAKKQNPELTRKYKVQGFPTVLIMDADGNVQAKTGYRRGGPKAFLKNLDSVLENAKKITQLKAEIAGLEAKSEERIKKIDAVAKSMTPREQTDNENLIREILDFDADGSKGFRKNYPLFTVYMPLAKKYQNINKTIYSKASQEFEKLKDKNSEAGKKIFTDLTRQYSDQLNKMIEELDAAAESTENEAVKDLILNISKRIKSQLEMK